MNSLRQHLLRKYKDGLPAAKLKQAIDYINEHLGEDLSLAEIAERVDPNSGVAESGYDV